MWESGRRRGGSHATYAIRMNPRLQAVSEKKKRKLGKRISTIPRFTNSWLVRIEENPFISPRHRRGGYTSAQVIRSKKWKKSNGRDKEI